MMCAIGNDYDTPTFNLKAVVLETGLKPDTLRAWERRYGVPQPSRTSGGHRLYSLRDIAMLKWLIARKREGMRISRAVALMERLMSEGKEPFETENFIPSGSPRNVRLLDGQSLSDLRQSWVVSCMAYDETAAEQALTQAFAVYPPETVCQQILQEGLRQIGEAWRSGDAIVQQEHFASELATRRLHALLASTAHPTRSGRILVACPQDEQHTFAPLLLTYLLRRNGWDALFLGANVPLDHLGRAISEIMPILVILSAQNLHTAATLMQAADLLAKREVETAFGGGIFNALPEIVERIRGRFLGERLDLAPQAVNRLLSSSHPIPPPMEISAGTAEAADSFLRRRPSLEAQVLRELEPKDIPHAQVTYAGMHLSRQIVAALSLGGMHLLGEGFSQIKNDLRLAGMAEHSIAAFLEAYGRAGASLLDESARPVKDWLIESSRV